MLENLPDVLGHALRDQRAGLDKIAFNVVKLRSGTGAIEVTSLAFRDHAAIPPRYTTDAEGLSPPLQWVGLPELSASLVLIVEDADSPTPLPLVHAIVVGLPANESALDEGSLDSPEHEGIGLKTGRNSFLGSRWLPPDPPPGHGVHRYAFQLFSLDRMVEFSATPGRDEVLEALRDCALASGLLVGTYERPDNTVRNLGDRTVIAPLAAA